MWLNQSSKYSYLNLESVKKLDSQLERDLNELKTEIEANEMVYGIKLKRPNTSIQAPKDAKNERKLYIERMLQVHDTRPIFIQADIFKEQIESSTKYEYKLETLPLLLHQFYLNRMSWCVQAKHAHLLRWKRFSQHTNVIEEMYPDFKNRLSYILSEYNDAVQRTQRLSVARDSLLSTGSCNNAILAMENDDLEIYLRWIVSHFYSIKNYTQFMKFLEWFPYYISSLNDQQSTEHSKLQQNQSLNQTNSQYSFKVGEDHSNGKSSVMTTTFLSQAKSEVKSESEANRFYSILDKIYQESTIAIPPTDENLNAISFLFNEGEVPILNNNIEFLLPRLRYFVNFYKIDYNLSRMHTSGDEMELFAAVNRSFRQLFAYQEHMKSFRTYDLVEAGQENWGADTPMHALKKESNWIKFIQLIPHKDAIYEKAISKIRAKILVDELLVSHSSFLEVNSDDRIQYILRENAPFVKFQPNIEAVNVTSNKTQFNSSNYWKKILNNLMIRDKPHDEDEMILPGDLDNSAVKAPKSMTFGNRNIGKKTNEFNYLESSQKRGLDDSNGNEQNLTGVQGSYLSFLILRHLRIRDLKRKALGLLNYFRSIERTITIYDGGLSFEGTSSFKRQSSQNHSKETSFGENLGFHNYMYNTPKDFKISEVDFMEFSEVDNHDDFYIIDDYGNVHVQDQRGFYIVYDAATSDLKKLEEELLLIASYYIEKHKENESAAKSNKVNDKKRKTTLQSTVLESELSAYSHQNVDRFAVLYDIWTNEVHFLEMKRKLLECYYEAYQNVFDKNERRNLAQLVTDLIHQRPRLDLDMSYFVNTYRLEISCLYKLSKIIRLLVDRLIIDMRDLSSKLNGQVKFGMPYPIIPKHLISVNMNDAQLKNVYMLEFHPALGVISRIPEALRYLIEDLAYKKNLQTVQERLLFEKYFFDILYEEYDCLDTPGSAFSPQVQKDLFNGVVVEDPLLMNELGQGLLKDLDETLKNKTRKEQTELTITTMARVVEMVTLRHRLLTAAMETEFLSKVYLKLASEMGFDSFHLYMRYIQFDFAKLNSDAGKLPPLYVNDLSMEDSKIDKFAPTNLCLAIQEVEEAQIGRFSFRSKEYLQTIVRTSGIENLQVILKMQLVHNSALVGAIMQGFACALHKNLAPIPTKSPPLTTDLAKDVLDSSTKDNASQTATKLSSSNKVKPFSEAFVSVQMEKNPSRNLMLNNFIQLKEKISFKLSNPIEMEKFKRRLINDFISKFSKRAYQYSLRAQLITLYYSITKILESFPNTRENHFVFGDPNERRIAANIKEATSNPNNPNPVVIPDEYLDELVPDPHKFKKRPRKLLSEDGSKVLNIWFIPHYLDLVVLFKKQPDDVSLKALKDSVRIISALNDILNLIYTNACLTSGSNTSTKTKKRVDFSSWENTGGIGSELNEIQHELNSLDDPCDPDQVSKLLEAKRNTLILQYECAIRHSVREVFLINSSYTAFKNVTENMKFGLRYLTDYPVGSFENVYLDLPEPIDPRDSILSEKMFPWHASISRNGPFPQQYWQWYLIEPNISLALSGLKNVEKNIANGEILGIHLLLEDILMLFNDEDEKIFTASEPLLILSKKEEKEEEIDLLGEKPLVEEQVPPKPVNEDIIVFTLNESISNPLKQFSLALVNYAKIYNFLITWKRLEVLKLDWIRRKTLIDAVNDPNVYAKSIETYKKEILLPVVRSLARKADAKEFLEMNIDESGPIILPKGISELQSKHNQISKILEKIEISMMNETTVRVHKDMRLVLNERGREETVLSTDLWKRSAMKEEFTLNKPHMVENFISDIYGAANHSEVSGQKVLTIGENELKDCLVRLGISVQEREKSNYEQYTMFYENILRQKCQKLYSNEREIQSLKDVIQQKVNELDVEVKCQMTEACYDLIMEVTALRAKIKELNDSSTNKEKEIREKIKSEFLDLITDLVNVNSRIKTQFDIYKEKAYIGVLELVARCRTEAFEMAAKLKNQFGSKIDEFAMSQQITQAKLIANLQSERYELQNLTIKQRSLTNLKLNRVTQKFQRELIRLNSNADKEKAKAFEACYLAEEKGILMDQEKNALQKQLKKLDIEYNNLKSKLDKEIHEKSLREFEAQQRLKNEKNLTMARQSNVDKIFEELESKDAELRNLYITTEKNTKMNSIQDAKIQREIVTIKKQLSQERSLKLDAFHKVDDLQSQVFDLEDEITNIVQIRPQTSKDSKNLRSAASSRSQTKYTTPFPRLNNFAGSINGLTTNSVATAINDSVQKSQRPKTANVKMKMTENSFNSNQSDSLFHDQVAKLKQIRLKSAVSQS